MPQCVCVSVVQVTLEFIDFLLVNQLRRRRRRRRG